MKAAKQTSESNLQPDSFRVGRVAALQPRLDLAAVAQAVMRTEDPAVLHGISNVVRMWSLSRHDLPADFCERVQIQAVSRQPLSFVAVDAEFVERKTDRRRTPFAGEACGSEPWPTDDLFELVPLEALSFPNEPVTREQPLPGHQTVHACDVCAGAGTQSCDSCESTGDVTCPTCDGARRVACTGCDGAGTHAGIRGNLVNCQLCDGRGTLSCKPCEGRGEITCARCGGDGQVLCGTCQGSGKMLHGWALVETTSTHGSRDEHWSSSWPISRTNLFDQCDLIWSTQWNLDGDGPPATTPSGILPAHLAPRAEPMIASAMRLIEGLDRSRQRLLGMRVRVFATYLYRVEFEYAGAAETLLLGGLSNRVFTQRGAERRGGWLRKIKTGCGRLLSRLWTGDQPAIDRAFLRAVQQGQVHIADSRRLMQSVRKLLPALVNITATGYEVAVEAIGEAPRNDVIEIDWDVDSSGQLLICFTSRLGDAHRDLFPRLLELNHRLSFGRFAVRVEPGAPGPALLLVDRRPYQTITPSHCAIILTAIAADICQLQRDRLFA